jgi:hypothetical protein
MHSAIWRAERVGAWASSGKGGYAMLWAIAVVLIVLWLLGFLVIHITSFAIHLLLLIAIIVIVYNLVAGSRTRGTV